MAFYDSNSSGEKHAVDAEWLLKHPRVSVLHVVLFIVFLYLFINEAALYRFKVEAIEGIARLRDIDPNFWAALIKWVLPGAILLTATRVYFSFFLLEGDAGFRYVIHKDTAQFTKILDVLFRTVVSSTTIFVIFLVKGAYELELLFAGISCCCWLWDSLLLCQYNRIILEMDQMLSDNPGLLALVSPINRKFDSQANPRRAPALEASPFKCYQNAARFREKIQHLERFKEKLDSWWRLDILFSILFVLQAIILSYPDIVSLPASLASWIILCSLVICLIVVFEIIEIYKFLPDFFRIIWGEIRFPKGLPIDCSLREIALINGVRLKETAIWFYSSVRTACVNFVRNVVRP